MNSYIPKATLISCTGAERDRFSSPSEIRDQLWELDQAIMAGDHPIQ
ncbi:MAG: hypothetical protein WBM44_10180 [Waterburya sp.]